MDNPVAKSDNDDRHQKGFSKEKRQRKVRNYRKKVRKDRKEGSGGKKYLRNCKLRKYSVGKKVFIVPSKLLLENDNGQYVLPELLPNYQTNYTAKFNQNRFYKRRGEKISVYETIFS